jgi:hypothetical protein
LCAVTFCIFFPLDGFEVFGEILENVLKIYTGTWGVMEH